MARRIYLFLDFICPDAHVTHKLVERGTGFVNCEHAGCTYCGVRPEVVKSLCASVHGDELDYIDHNLGRDPVHIRSKSQRRALMAAAGLEEFIRHTPVPGTDKSPHTIPWTTMDPQTMANAVELVSRQGGKRYIEDDPIAPVANPFVYVADNDHMKRVTDIVEGK